MIQRIQSVWLLLAAICIFLTYTLSFYAGVRPGFVPEFVGDTDKLKGTDSLLLILATFTIGALALVIIFLFINAFLSAAKCKKAPKNVFFRIWQHLEAMKILKINTV